MPTAAAARSSLPRVSCRGAYRLWFGVGTYFAASGTPTLYPEISIVFQVHEPGAGYHLPLLLNPFGYSTYRGS